MARSVLFQCNSTSRIQCKTGYLVRPKDAIKTTTTKESKPKFQLLVGQQPITLDYYNFPFIFQFEVLGLFLSEPNVANKPAPRQG